MIGETQARQLGNEAFENREVVLGPARELEHGWHFPVIMKGVPTFEGVIVNKESGRPLRLFIGSGPAALEKYDRGYQFDHFDLVILSISDFEETVRAVMTFGFGTPRTYYRGGKVWRIGRDTFTEEQIRERLRVLPCIFSGRFLYDTEFERARETGSFDFTLFECAEPED